MMALSELRDQPAQLEPWAHQDSKDPPAHQDWRELLEHPVPREIREHQVLPASVVRVDLLDLLVRLDPKALQASLDRMEPGDLVDPQDPLAQLEDPVSVELWDQWDPLVPQEHKDPRADQAPEAHVESPAPRATMESQAAQVDQELSAQEV